MKPVRSHNANNREADDALVAMDAVELAAFKMAIEEARTDKRGVPHEEVAAWLMQIAAGNFDVPIPVARELG